MRKWSFVAAERRAADYAKHCVMQRSLDLSIQKNQISKCKVMEDCYCICVL